MKPLLSWVSTLVLSSTFKFIFAMLLNLHKEIRSSSRLWAGLCSQVHWRFHEYSIYSNKRFIQCHQLKLNTLCQPYPIISEMLHSMHWRSIFVILQKGVCHIETEIHKIFNFLNPVLCLFKLKFGKFHGGCIHIIADLRNRHSSYHCVLAVIIFSEKFPIFRSLYNAC